MGLRSRPATSPPCTSIVRGPCPVQNCLAPRGSPREPRPSPLDLPPRPVDGGRQRPREGAAPSPEPPLAIQGKGTALGRTRRRRTLGARSWRTWRSWNRSYSVNAVSATALARRRVLSLHAGAKTEAECARRLPASPTRRLPTPLTHAASRREGSRVKRSVGAVRCGEPRRNRGIRVCSRGVAVQRRPSGRRPLPGTTRTTKRSKWT